MPDPIDPFTAAYRATLGALKESVFLRDQCKVKVGEAPGTGNVPDLTDGTTDALMASGSMPADFPALILIQGACLIKPFGSNSKVAELIKTYPLIVLTDTLQVVDVNKVEYGICGALYHADLERNAGFLGNEFIRDVEVTGASDGTSGLKLPGVDEPLPPNRWSAIVNIRYVMWVPRELLPR